jgi:hypothetical protein
VGGRTLSYRFWREFAEIDNVVAIKIAPFNRYQTLDVVRAVAESGREISLYTGNDDSFVMDLLTPFVFRVNGEMIERRIVGGLLGIGRFGRAEQSSCSRSVTPPRSWKVDCRQA